MRMAAESDQVIAQKFSVESIDTYIRLILSYL